MISLRHITKRFGEALALDDVSLDLAPGERLGLIGENGAGKSSLMNVLYGLYHPDGGELAFDGQAQKVRSPQDAIARGVGMVHQHFTLVPNLTVAENVVLGAEPTRGGLFDLEAAVRVVDETCKKLGFSLDARARVDRLSVGSQQKVEIVKALRRGAKTLILDEPTAVLTPQETDDLFRITRELSEQGSTVVLITHKLKDVLAFATRIAVMRRGRKVAEVRPADTTGAQLAELMVGGAMHDPAAPPSPLGATEPFLTLEGVSAEGLHDLSLEVRAGEILGVAGVDGNGQRELAEVVTGLRPLSRGRLKLGATHWSQLTPAQARACGVAHIPEDRLHRAMVADMTVEENVALGRQHQAPFARGLFIDFAGRRARTAQLLEAHDVRPRDPVARMGSLSGGNQQKLVVARELDTAPRLLVVVQPTRGLDIAAVNAVRQKLLERARAGCAVLLVSLDLEEVLALADRVVVMFEGRLNGTFTRGACDERELGRRMLGAAA
ncbi:MAG: ABC transporter ATP-binding protein [Archangiaceae bacterium]|nr:ABC transporter ATP-binding protein [Archangiaceae bacterium]